MGYFENARAWMQAHQNAPQNIHAEYAGSDFAPAVQRGLLGLVSALYGLSGSPSARAEVEQLEAQKELYPPRFRSSDEVNWFNPGQVVDYGQQVIGESLPSTALMAGSAAVTGGGTALLRGAASNLIKRNATLGAIAGDTAMQTGDMANELRDAGKEPGLMTPVLGLGAAALDVYGLTGMASSMLKSAGAEAVKAAAGANLSTSLLKGAALGAGRSMVKEVPSEVGQEGLAIVNRALYDPAYREGHGDEILHRLKETGIAAATQAGFMGAGPGAIGGLRSALAKPAAPAPEVTEPAATPEATPVVPAPDVTHSEQDQPESTTIGSAVEPSENSEANTPKESPFSGTPFERLVNETNRRFKAEGVRDGEIAQWWKGLDYSPEQIDFAVRKLNPRLADTPDQFLPHAGTQFEQKIDSINEANRSEGLHDFAIADWWNSLEHLDPHTKEFALHRLGQTANDHVRTPSELPEHLAHLTGTKQEAFVDQQNAAFRQEGVPDGEIARFWRENSGSQPLAEFAMHRLNATRPTTTQEQTHGQEASTKESPNASPYMPRQREEVLAPEAPIPGDEVRRLMGVPVRPGLAQKKAELDAFLKDLHGKKTKYSDALKAVDVQWPLPSIDEDEITAARKTALNRQAKARLKEIGSKRWKTRGFDFASLAAPVTSEVSASTENGGPNPVGETPDAQSHDMSLEELAKEHGVSLDELPNVLQKRAYFTPTGAPDVRAHVQHGLQELADVATARTRKALGLALDRSSNAMPDAEEEADLLNEGMNVHKVTEPFNYTRSTNEHIERALGTLFPEVKTERTPDGRHMTATFPIDETSEQEGGGWRVAGAVFTALHEGRRNNDAAKTVKLEHPGLTNETSGKAIGVPISKKGLADIGRALSPGTFDESAAGTHRAQIDGLNYLMMRGFRPQVSTTQAKALGFDQVAMTDGKLADKDAAKQYDRWLRHALPAPKQAGTSYGGPKPTASLDPELNPRLQLLGWSRGRHGLHHEVADEVGIPALNLVTAKEKENDPSAALKNQGAQGRARLHRHDSTIVFDAEGDALVLKTDKPQLRISKGELSDVRAVGEKIRAFLIEHNIKAPVLTTSDDVGVQRAARRALVYALRPDVRAMQNYKTRWDSIGDHTPVLWREGRPSNGEHVKHSTVRGSTVITREPTGRTNKVGTGRLALASSEAKADSIVDVGPGPVDVGPQKPKAKPLPRLALTSEDLNDLDGAVAKIRAFLREHNLKAPFLRAVGSNRLVRALKERLMPNRDGFDSEDFEARPERDELTATPAEQKVIDRVIRRVRELFAKAVPDRTMNLSPWQLTEMWNKAVDQAMEELPAATVNLKHVAAILKQDFADELDRQSRERSTSEKPNAELNADDVRNLSFEGSGDSEETRQLSAALDAEEARLETERADRAQSLGKQVDLTTATKAEGAPQHPGDIAQAALRGAAPIRDEQGRVISPQPVELDPHRQAALAAQAEAVRTQARAKRQFLAETGAPRAKGEQSTGPARNDKGKRTRTGSVLYTAIAEHLPRMLNTILADTGLDIHLRLVGQGGIQAHLDALVAETTELNRRMEASRQMLREVNATEAQQRRVQRAIDRDAALLDEISTEIHNLLDAKQDTTWAARIIYNDHYTDPARRVPVLLVNDIVSGLNLDKQLHVLGHEIGHLIQRAWFDSLSAEDKAALIRELVGDSQDPREFAEAFADKFVEWYRLARRSTNNRESRAEHGKTLEAGLNEGAMTDAQRMTAEGPRNPRVLALFADLYQKLQQAWRSLCAKSTAFRRQNPHFDDFMAATVGVYSYRKLSLAQRRIGQSTWDKRHGPVNSLAVLPLRSEMLAESHDASHDMTLEELVNSVKQTAQTMGLKTQTFTQAQIAKNPRLAQAAASQRAKSLKQSLSNYWEMAGKAKRMFFTADAAALRNVAAQNPHDLSWLTNFADMVANEKGKEFGHLVLMPETRVQIQAGSQTKDVWVGTKRLPGLISNLIDRRTRQYARKAEELFEMYPALRQPGTPEHDQIVEQLRLRDAVPASQRLPAVLAVQGFFNRLYQDMQAAGESFGFRPGYSPRPWDINYLLNNEKEVVARFTQVFERRVALGQELPVWKYEHTATIIHRAYTDANGNTVESVERQNEVPFRTPKEAAEKIYERLIEGATEPPGEGHMTLHEAVELGFEQPLRGASFPWARTPPFSDTEFAQFSLTDFVSSDIEWMMQTYAQMAARRMVWRRAGGIPLDQLRNPETAMYWRDRCIAAGLNPSILGGTNPSASSPLAALEIMLAEASKQKKISDEEYKDLKDNRIPSILGNLNVGKDPLKRRWVKRITGYETILLLGLGIFAQLSDPGVAAWRAESWERVGKGISAMLDKATRDQQKQLLDSIGIAIDEASRWSIRTTDPIGQGMAKATETMFLLNGMQKLSEMTTMFSSILGQSYIQDFGQQAIHGATPEERALAVKRLKELNPNLTPQMAIAGDFTSTSTRAGIMQLALREYISQSHIGDQQGYTPWVTNDYRFQVFMQLKTFSYKFHNIIVKLLWERMKEQPDLIHAMMPLLSLVAFTLPLAFAGMWAKDKFRRDLPAALGLTTDRKPKERSVSEKLVDALMATGVPGVYAGFADQMWDASSYGQPAIIALMGPAVGHGWNLLTRSADEWIPASVPVVASIPGLRSAARGVLHDTLGLGVRKREKESAREDDGEGEEE